MNSLIPQVSPETLRKAKIAKWAVIALGVAIAAPAALLLLKGLLALLAAAVLGLGAIYLGPVIELKLKNTKVKMIVEEVQRNPIESMLNQLVDKRSAAEQFAKRITEFRTQVKNYEHKVEGYEKDYPADAPRFRAQLQTMDQLLKFREDRYQEVKTGLDNFEKALDRMTAMWNMAQAAQRMNEAAGQQSGDTFEKIKTDAAIDSVMNSVNHAFSQMETALLDAPHAEAVHPVLTDEARPAIAVDPRVALPQQRQQQ